jgi:hypothetical protein
MYFKVSYGFIFYNRNVYLTCTVSGLLECTDVTETKQLRR